MPNVSSVKKSKMSNKEQNLNEIWKKQTRGQLRLKRFCAKPTGRWGENKNKEKKICLERVSKVIKIFSRKFHWLLLTF